MVSITLRLPPHILTPVPSDSHGPHSSLSPPRLPAHAMAAARLQAGPIHPPIDFISAALLCYSVFTTWGVGRGGSSLRSPPRRSLFAPRCAVFGVLPGRRYSVTIPAGVTALRYLVLMSEAIRCRRRGLHRRYLLDSVFLSDAVVIPGGLPALPRPRAPCFSVLQVPHPARAHFPVPHKWVPCGP